MYDKLFINELTVFSKDMILIKAFGQNVSFSLIPGCHENICKVFLNTSSDTHIVQPLL